MFLSIFFLLRNRVPGELAFSCHSIGWGDTVNNGGYFHHSRWWNCYFHSRWLLPPQLYQLNFCDVLLFVVLVWWGFYIFVFQCITKLLNFLKMHNQKTKKWKKECCLCSKHGSLQTDRQATSQLSHRTCW